MNIKEYFVLNGDFDKILLINDYITFINTNMESISGWKSFRQVYYEPVVFALVEDSKLDLILLTRRFLNQKKIENIFSDEDIIVFWSKDISTLFDMKYSHNIWGYFLSHMSYIHFEAVIESDVIVWIDDTITKYLHEYIKSNNQDFHNFMYQYKIYLQINQIIDDWLEADNFNAKILLENNITNLIRYHYPEYSDIWREKSYWQKSKEVISFVDIVKNKIYAEYKLDFLNKNNNIKIDNNVKLSREEFVDLVNQELKMILQVLVDTENFNFMDKETFFKKSVLRLEPKLGVFVANKLIFYLLEYVYRLEEIGSILEKESSLDNYQGAFLENAMIGLDVLVSQIYQNNN